MRDPNTARGEVLVTIGEHKAIAYLSLATCSKIKESTGKHPLGIVGQMEAMQPGEDGVPDTSAVLENIADLPAFCEIIAAGIQDGHARYSDQGQVLAGWSADQIGDELMAEHGPAAIFGMAANIVQAMFMPDSRRGKAEAPEDQSQ